MNWPVLYEGLLNYLYLVIIVTFHEFGHAWMADRLGDDTPRVQGRVTLNPLQHIDTLGTVILPLLVVVLAATGNSGLGSFIIGWGRPVMFNPSNLQHRRRDATFIALAGPVMNILLAALALGLAWGGVVSGAKPVLEVCVTVALLSLYLCFFNLLPVPPLDGSHVVHNVLGLREELYYQISRYGFFIIIIAIQLPPVRALLAWLTGTTFGLMVRVLALPFGG